MNFEIDKSDQLYKYLQNIGVSEEQIEDEYKTFATSGLAKISDIKKALADEVYGNFGEEIDEQILESLLPYYLDIKNIEAVKQNELKEMLQKYFETKSDELAKTIISSQLTKVIAIAYHFKIINPDLIIEDLIQVGNIGLITALKKYNPYTKLNFDDYIAYWVRNEIINEFLTEDRG